MLESIILVLTLYWLISFFALTIAPGLPHAGCFTDTLSVIIVTPIAIRFFIYFSTPCFTETTFSAEA
ncbi:MAG TPA: hypothetical protein VFY26_20020 [Anaerolineales bacterium]|nr:hypothetical protein [Anaerolineales bacterium]